LKSQKKDGISQTNFWRAMDKHSWKKEGACQNSDTEIFFDRYEEDVDLRPKVESLCAGCPVARQCFAVGVSQKEWGVWGGIYLENGSISREFSRHKTKEQWAQTWKYLTNDN
jgi:hypothetical protein